MNVLHLFRFCFYGLPNYRLLSLAVRLAHSTALHVPTLPPVSFAVCDIQNPFTESVKLSDETVIPLPLNFVFQQIKSCCRLPFLSSGYSGISYRCPATAASVIKRTFRNKRTRTEPLPCEKKTSFGCDTKPFIRIP